jgi:hypothetical protein
MERKAITSITLILVGNMLTTYNSIGSGWTATTTAIIGFILFFIGLGQLKDFMDEKGKSGVSLLVNAAILGIIALILDFIPLVGGVFAGILYCISFVIQFIGLLKLKSSETIGTTGLVGVNNLLVAMILMIIGSILSILPFAGEYLNSVISLIALILVLIGWLKFQEAIIEKTNIPSV